MHFSWRNYRSPNFVNTKKVPVFTKLRHCATPYMKTDEITLVWSCWCISYREIAGPQIRKDATCRFYEIAKRCKSLWENEWTYNVVAMLLHFLQWSNIFLNLDKNVKYIFLRNCEMVQILIGKRINGRCCCNVGVSPTRKLHISKFRKNATCRFTKVRDGASPYRETNDNTVLLQCWCISYKGIADPTIS